MTQYEIELIAEISKLKQKIKALEQRNSFLEKRLQKKKNKPEEIRRSKEYKIFREKILSRDNHKCTKCGSDRKLHIHHLKSIGKYPELALEESNVVTLCIKCHSETENYLKK